MEEVTRICDEVIFLDHGKIFAQDTPLGLTKKIEFATLNLTFDGRKAKVEEFLKKKEEFEFTHTYSVTIKTKEKGFQKLILVSLKRIFGLLILRLKANTRRCVFKDCQGKNES